MNPDKELDPGLPRRMHRPIGLQFLLVRVLEATGVFVLSFGAAIIPEALALMMPTKTASGETHFIDALLTSTSAVCVTDLMALDTGS